jgi:hypothetical protein
MQAVITTNGHAGLAEDEVSLMALSVSQTIYLNGMGQ